jgi:hypothetical protein
MIALNTVYIGLCLLFLSFLYPHLGKIISLVGIYGITLFSFGRLAWARYGRVNKLSFYLVMIGSNLFICSNVFSSLKKFDVFLYQRIDEY